VIGKSYNYCRCELVQEAVVGVDSSNEVPGVWRAWRSFRLTIRVPGRHARSSDKECFQGIWCSNAWWLRT
jgi:hypothetical protein